MAATSNPAPPIAASPGEGTGDEVIVLRLYVTGSAPHSVLAIRNVRRLCETHLRGRYDLKIFDLYQHPSLARDAQIVAAPTLVKELPLPLQRFIGTLTDATSVLRQLTVELEPKDRGAA